MSIIAAYLSIAIKANAFGVIRDAEIENTLQILAKPIFDAAEIDNKKVHIFIINDKALNAFIINNKSVFFTSGLLLELKTPGMFQAVLAHEVAHIISGHILKTKLNLDKLNQQANLGLMLGVVVASTLNSDAGLAISLGASSVAQNSAFSHSRGQEIIADAIGLNLLSLAKIDLTNATETLRIFANREEILNLNKNIYSSTHPASSDRIKYLEEIIEQKPSTFSTTNQKIKNQYEYSLAKLGAFIRKPKDTLNMVQNSDKNELTLLSKTIALHRKPAPKEALKTIKKLIEIKGTTPYLLELLGQIHLDVGKIDKAIEAFSQASAFAPKEPSFLIWLGISHLALENKENDQLALEVLKKAHRMDPINPRLLRYLAIAYARNENYGQAALKMAEHSLVFGNFKAAMMHANKAITLLNSQSFELRRASDILEISNQIGVEN